MSDFLQTVEAALAVDQIGALSPYVVTAWLRALCADLREAQAQNANNVGLLEALEAEGVRREAAEQRAKQAEAERDALKVKLGRRYEN